MAIQLGGASQEIAARPVAAGEYVAKLLGHRLGKAAKPAPTCEVAGGARGTSAALR